MQSVGTRLREAREQKGYSLGDINTRTRINAKNLVAIESDEVNQISSPFIYRSFVRQYAEEVGLDFRLLSAGVELMAGTMRQPELPGQGEHQIVRVAPIQARPKRDWTWVKPTAALLGLLVLGGGGYAYLKVYNPSALQTSAIESLFSTQSSPTQESDPKKIYPKKVENEASNPGAVPTPLKVDGDEGVATESDAPAGSVTTSKPEAPQGKSPQPTQPQASVVPKLMTPAADRIRLELAATERTWLSVSADGKTAYTGILEPLETKVLEGQDSARVRTGNAGGVSIIFNGKSIGAIGPRGTTRTVIFSKTGYEIEPEGTTVSQANHIGG